MRRRNEKGAMSVEFALCMPALIVLILGGLHLGRVLGVRHRLADATGYATRAAAIAQNGTTANVRQLIESRFAGDTMCKHPMTGITAQIINTAPYRRLEVTAKCVLNPAYGSGLLGAIGPSDVSVTAAMPY
jgi:Flp pilus assembly protein TadG